MIKVKKLFKNEGALGFLICYGTSLLLLAIAALVCTLVLSFMENPTAVIGVFSLMAMLLSAVGGGIFTARAAGTKSKAIYTPAVALAVVLSMLLAAVIINAGKIGGGAFMNYGCYLGVYTLAGYFLGHGRKKRPRR